MEEIYGVQPLDLNGLGVVIEPKNNKTLLIDADTIAVKAAIVNQEVTQWLPEDFYTESEWATISSHWTFDPVDLTSIECNLESAFERAIELIDRIKEVTGCEKVELHFTKGKKSFRYDILPSYKANRKKIKPIVGLGEVKKYLSKHYKAYTWDKWEADEIIVFKKKKQPEKYLMCYVDKDVGHAVEGRHFNYYESKLHNIDMKFVDITADQVRMWPYVQCLLGDSSDNIIGPKPMGPKTMLKFLGTKVKKAEWDLVAAQFKEKGATKKTADLYTCIHFCDHTKTNEQLWDSVITGYKSKGLSEDLALLNMNCLNMNCITDFELHKYKYRDEDYAIKPWYTPKGKTIKGLLND